MSAPVVDSCEPFIDFRSLHPRIVVDESRSQIASRSAYFCFGRVSVADRLKQSVSELPEPFRFLVKEAYRPPHIQRRSFDAVFRHYRGLDSNPSDADIYREVSKYVAPIETAPHPTGAAIDVTLIDRDGVEADMGTAFNADPAETADRTYFASPNVSVEATAHRRLLRDALVSAGFVNYPTEWWHWSYGDKYWAALTGQPAIYIAIEEKNLGKRIVSTTAGL